MKTHPLTLALCVLCTAACSTLEVGGADSETGTPDEAQLRITPDGGGIMSTLVLQLPTGSCLAGGSCAHPLTQAPAPSLDAIGMTLGQGLRVAPGDHALTVSGIAGKVKLTAGATRTLVLPVAKEVCTNGTPTPLPSSDFGRVPVLRYASCPGIATLDGVPISNLTASASTSTAWAGDACNGQVLWSNINRSFNCSALQANAYTVGSVSLNGGPCIDVPNQEWKAACQSWDASGGVGLGVPVRFTSDTALLPGTYGFSVESSTGMTTETRTLAEGDVKDLVFTLPQIGVVPPQFTTTLTFADPRQLPDAIAASITSNCERNYTVPATASGTLSLKAFQFPSCNYTLNVSGRTVALTQTAGNNITLYRLDVDDVAVTREDGTQYTVRGSYELYFGGQLTAGPFSTNTGLNLLSGAYELVVKYTTALGPQTAHYTFSL